MELGAILDVLAEEAFEDREESVEQPGENVRELEQRREIPGVVDKVDVPGTKAPQLRDAECPTSTLGVR